MVRDLIFKKKIIGWTGSVLIAILTFLFREPFVEFLTLRITVPFFVFPLISALSIFIIFFIRWLLLFRNKRLKANRMIIKPGSVIGVINGPSNVLAVEWSWINPTVLIAQTKEGHHIRVHYTSIIFYS